MQQKSYNYNNFIILFIKYFLSQEFFFSRFINKILYLLIKHLMNIKILLIN
jgi:hypothetical protein